MLRCIAGALAPGGLLLLTATAAAGLVAGFVEQAVMTGADGATPPFDPASFVTQSRTMAGPDGTILQMDAWWRAYTPRELTLLCRLCGLGVERLYGGRQGSWEGRPPRLDDADLLLVARKQ